MPERLVDLHSASRGRCALSRVPAGRSARAASRGVPRPGDDAGGLPDLLRRARSGRPAAPARAHRLRSAELACHAAAGGAVQCEATREAVSEARHAELASTAPTTSSRLWEHADIRGLVVDDGYPLPQVDPIKLAEEAGIDVHRVVRIEPVIVRLREPAATYGELEDAFSAEIEAACTAGGAVAIKSVIAYRTGLDVAEWPRAEVEVSYLQLGRGGLPRDPRAGKARARRAAACARSRSPSGSAVRCTSTAAAAIPASSSPTPGRRICSRCSTGTASSRSC